MEAISEDLLLGGRVRIQQPVEGYRVAIDPILLAASIDARDGERILDLGCGVGAVGLCLLARLPRVQVVGLEVQPTLAALAGENARANAMEDRFTVHEGNIVARTVGTKEPPFDQVAMNPPYLPSSRATLPLSASKRRATMEESPGLQDWIDAGLEFLKPRGRLTLIQRADRLETILAALAGRAGEIVIFPIWPGGGRDAKRVIVTARKSARTPSRLAIGMVLHQADGSFTPEAEAVLRDAAAIELQATRVSLSP